MIAMFSQGQLGATFLDWSIKYLRGDNTYISWPNLDCTALCANPLNTANAHSHKKIHPEGFENTRYLVDRYHNSDKVSFDFKELGFDQVGEQLALDVTHIDSTKVQQLKLQQQQDTTNAVLYCVGKKCNIIRIEINPAVKIFQCYDRGDGHDWLTRRYPNSLDSPQTLWWKAFFNDKEFGTDSWDRREYMALNVRPLDDPALPPLVDWKFKNFRIDCLQWWMSGQSVLNELFDWLEVDIDSSRWETWQLAYQQWQQILRPDVEFALNANAFVQAIVQGQYLKLPQLTLFQEAILQHFLIYKHNLNIKTWKLESFPNNTIELHQLLEPNHHPVVPLY
jgi:hypothetical protein